MKQVLHEPFINQSKRFWIHAENMTLQERLLTDKARGTLLLKHIRHNLWWFEVEMLANRLKHKPYGNWWPK